MAIVTAKVGYLDRNTLYAEEKPYELIYKLRWISQEDYRLTNMVITQHAVTIHNIRGKESQRTLDVNGYQVAKHQSACSFKDRGSIKDVYIDEMEKLLEDVLSATRVCIYHWRVSLLSCHMIAYRDR